MKVELEERTASLLTEAMVRGGYPDVETTIHAGLWALRDQAEAIDRWWNELGPDGQREFLDSIDRARGQIAEGKTVPGEVAMQRARELVERKRQAGTAPE